MYTILLRAVTVERRTGKLDKLVKYCGFSSGILTFYSVVNTFFGKACNKSMIVSAQFNIYSFSGFQYFLYSRSTVFAISPVRAFVFCIYDSIVYLNCQAAINNLLGCIAHRLLYGGSISEGNNISFAIKLPRHVQYARATFCIGKVFRGGADALHIEVKDFVILLRHLPTVSAEGGFRVDALEPFRNPLLDFIQQTLEFVRDPLVRAVELRRAVAQVCVREAGEKVLRINNAKC